MKRTAILIYGAISYTTFLWTFIYAIGFVGNIGVPKSIDTGIESAWPIALGINALLLGVFAIQHSVMARPFFKRWLTRFIPQSAERSTYVLASNIAFIALFALWRPITGEVFSVEGEMARNVITAIYFAGVCLVLYSTFLIDHFDLFGLRQVVLQFQGKPYTHKQFTTPSLYKHIRHPLYVGWFLVFWATPDMTLGHLLMAIGTTGYILVAIIFEEQDLGDALGDDYKAYRARTPMFIPKIKAEVATPAPVESRA